jgi:hypothetical protein
VCVCVCVSVCEHFFHPCPPTQHCFYPCYNAKMCLLKYVSVSHLCK